MKIKAAIGEFFDFEESEAFRGRSFHFHVETDYRRIAAIRNDAFRVNDTDFGDIEIGLLTEGGEIRVNYTIAVIALDIDIIVFEFRFDATRKRQEVRVGGIGNIVFNIGDIETQGAISIG